MILYKIGEVHRSCAQIYQFKITSEIVQEKIIKANLEALR